MSTTPISSSFPLPPSSPSNPPSPDERDVPLLRLDTPPAQQNRRRGPATPTSLLSSDRDRMAAGSSSGRASPISNSSAGQPPRERKQSNPLSQFRSSNSLRSSVASSSSTVRTGGAGPLWRGRAALSVNPKGKDRYSDAADDDEVDLLTGQQALRGAGESDGEFDEGWSGDLPREEEEIQGLLAGDKVSRVQLRTDQEADTQAVPDATA